MFFFHAKFIVINQSALKKKILKVWQILFIRHKDKDLNKQKENPALQIEYEARSNPVCITNIKGVSKMYSK